MLILFNIRKPKRVFGSVDRVVTKNFDPGVIFKR